MYKILQKEKISENVEKIIVEAPLVAKKCNPGQFVIIRTDQNSERIPLTIVDYNREDGSITIIYQIVGFSTKKLSSKKEGESIEDLTGPLGKAIELNKNYKKVLGIGGGVGAAPLFPQLKAYNDLEIETEVILGGRNKELILLKDEFMKFCKNVYITTDDGSEGDKGVVTDKLSALIEDGNKYDHVIAIGPAIMMKYVSLLTKKNKISTSVSLNPIMIDGTGMCGGCRVTVDNEVKFACVDGPDFDGHSVDFDELMRRQGMYKKEENHICNIGLKDRN